MKLIGRATGVASTPPPFHRLTNVGGARLLRSVFASAIHNRALCRSSLFLLCLLAAVSWAGEAGFRLDVQVRDAVTGGSLGGASVQLFQRGIVALPDGRVQLLPIEASGLLSETAAGEDGRAGFVVDLAGLTSVMLMARVDKTGYHSQWASQIMIEEGQGQAVVFDLVPNEIAEVDAGRLLVPQEAAVAQVEEAPFDPAFADGPSALGTGEYPVPEQVWVSNLAGSGFTGWMDLDELIAGTVSAEEGDGFSFEALKAQAVAARTFALHRLATRGQANGGQAYTANIGSKSRTSAWNTRGVVLLHSGRIIPAYFSARCNGDATLNSEEGPTLSNCRVGGLGAGVVAWARSRPCSGHVNCSETSETCCTIEVRGTAQHIYGHGIGMCQRGAQQFAGRDGWSWDQILTNYYTGIEIANGTGTGLNSIVAATANLNVRGSPCGSAVRNVPAGSRGRIVGGPARPLCALAAPYSYFTWWEVAFENGAQGWAVEDYLRDTLEPPVVDVTVNSVPSGLPFKAGGGAFETPHTFEWAMGTVQTVEFDSTISMPSGRLVFVQWADGDRRNSRLFEISSPALHVAEFMPEPVLSIASSENGIVLSWPAGPGPLVLEATASLEPPILWEPVPGAVVRDGTYELDAPVDGESRFYRLRTPDL